MAKIRKSWEEERPTGSAWREYTEPYQRMPDQMAPCCAAITQHLPQGPLERSMWLIILVIEKPRNPGTHILVRDLWLYHNAVEENKLGAGVSMWDALVCNSLLSKMNSLHKMSVSLSVGNAFMTPFFLHEIAFLKASPPQH